MGADLYRIQGFILDELASLGFQDRDGFSVQAAQLYLARRLLVSETKLLEALSAVRTSTFAPKRHQRSEVTGHVLKALDRQYLSRLKSRAIIDIPSPSQTAKIEGLATKARRVSGRDQFHELMLEFRRAVRLNGVSGFWKSRRASKLKPQPESIAQQALAMFLHMPIKKKAGIVLEEVKSGTGYVDVMAHIGSRSYVVELKILTGKSLRGVHQLVDYLGLRSLDEGWLIVFDARAGGDRTPLIDEVRQVDGKTINLLPIDINPARPSSKK